MPRYRAKSWRAFDPAARAPGPAEVVPLPAVAAGGAPLRILGLDPGSQRTGFGVIDARGADCVHVAHGTIDVAKRPLAGRLRGIFQAVDALIREYDPAEVAIERVFVNRNVDSALKLGQARGAALSAVPDGALVYEYAPRAVKLAVVGFGAADKAQVAHMVKVLLALDGRLGADASDALAIAVCHAHSRRARQLVAVGGTAVRRAVPR